MVRRCVENENSGSDVLKLNATPSYLKPDGDDVEVQERWTPTPGCTVCESAHANKHLLRCEARRYEYRLKYRRNPPVTTHRVYHRLQGKQSQAQSDRGKQSQAQNHESSVSTHVDTSQPMDLSGMPARVRLNMKRSPFESQGDRSKQDV